MRWKYIQKSIPSAPYWWQIINLAIFIIDLTESVA
jgi:hypothetical protein